MKTASLSSSRIPGDREVKHEMDYTQECQGGSRCLPLADFRRFVDPQAQFLFVEERDLLDESKRLDAVPFDAPKIEAIKLNHRGPRCSFEAIIEDYAISDPAIHQLGLIVRAADVNGQEGIAPEGVGLRAIAQGFAATGISDEERLARQFPVYDALYAYTKSKV